MADVIDIFVNNKKAVVGFGTVMQSYSRILGIMPLHILTKLTGNLTVVNINRYSGETFGELNEDRIVNIIVNNRYTGLGLTDKSGDERIGIENLTVKEYALFNLFRLV